MSSNLEAMFHYFIKMRKKHPNLDSDLRRILRRLRSPEDAMCMADIKGKFPLL